MFTVSLEVKAMLAAVVAIVVTGLATPLMARTARAIGLMDRPGGYKQHERATPYLGGAAILLGVIAAVLLVQGVGKPVPVVLLAAAAMCALGTIDDWRPIAPGVRLAVQAMIGAAIWAGDAGWAIASPAWVELLLTIGWVVLAVNTLNLLDNLDGAAASVAAASALGVTAIAIVTGGAVWAAVVAAAVGAACLGFLPFNLSRPARLFLGDGGSTVIGLLIAVSAMGALNSEPSHSYLAAALLIAVPMVDTALVMISRHRRGISVLSGGVDHLTHRVNARVHDPRKVALELASAQLALSAVAALAILIGPMATVIATACYAVAAAAVIAALETVAAPTVPATSSPHPVEGGGISVTTPVSGANRR
jgi:UDP-GlcNAc:undecaprenyl-phosphate/decaprenyl-phosphate GlcNAc-1-phosphate transferase